MSSCPSEVRARAHFPPASPELTYPFRTRMDGARAACQAACGMRISDCGFTEDEGQPGFHPPPSPQSEIRIPQSVRPFAGRGAYNGEAGRHIQTLAVLAEPPRPGVLLLAAAAPYLSTPAPARPPASER